MYYGRYGHYGQEHPDIDEVLQKPITDPGTKVAESIKDLPTDVVPDIDLPGYKQKVTPGGTGTVLVLAGGALLLYLLLS